MVGLRREIIPAKFFFAKASKEPLRSLGEAGPWRSRAKLIVPLVLCSRIIMLNSEILDNIKTLIAPILGEEKLCLVDANFCLQGGRWFLRLLVDKIYGGITLDECARLNEKIGEFIERQNLIKQSYVLEVSSPGTNRPLLTREDFSRCLNRKVRIFFNQCQEAKTEITGVIVSVNDTGVNINSEGQIQQIPFDRIRRARQII